VWCRASGNHLGVLLHRRFLPTSPQQTPLHDVNFRWLGLQAERIALLHHIEIRTSYPKTNADGYNYSLCMVSTGSMHKGMLHGRPTNANLGTWT
jgi:hypothetical protein